MTNARAIAEETARASYGRLIAFLAVRTRDIAAAEDALGDAFAAALTHWPASGVPKSPEAWLLTSARRKLVDQSRRAQTVRDAQPDILSALDEAAAMTRREIFEDERLRLLFVCTHPAIDESIRTPLMLQTVLGLDAARIASAFLVAPSTMSQRLVRAKRKIARAGLSFAAPDEADLGARAGSVLDAIYAAFGAGYDAAEGDHDDLSAEALFLARLAAALLPSEPEAQGLLALTAYAEARRRARRLDGVYVPLDEQETALWSAELIDEADAALARAAGLQRPGRFQIEAAIQSAHISARLRGEDTRAAIVRLYDRLIALAPSVGAEIGRAAALLKAGRAEEARLALDCIDPERIAAHQPYWATRAAVLAALGAEEADAAITRAIGLSSDAAIRAFLQRRRSAVSPPRTRL